MAKKLFKYEVEIVAPDGETADAYMKQAMTEGYGVQVRYFFTNQGEVSDDDD